jgi:hypothetical protein
MVRIKSHARVIEKICNFILVMSSISVLTPTKGNKFVI